MAPHISALVHLAVLVACVLPSGVWSHVTSHDVAFRIDSVAFGEGRTRDWVINGDELPSAQDKPVLLSALIVIETDDVSCRSKREYAAPKGRPWGAGRGKGLYQQGSGGDCEPQTSLPSQNRLASKSANPKAYGHVLLVRICWRNAPRK